jgi:hypothetical protein
MNALFRTKQPLTTKQENQTIAYDPATYPEFPPPPPAEILANRAAYLSKIRQRKFWVPRGIYEDSSLYCLYRIYEFLVVDHVTGYRNHIEDLWKQRVWAISDISDPKDDNPTRYAFLACIPHLLVKAFNAKIKLGVARNTPAIISPEEAEELRTRPESTKHYESVPEWTKLVPPLSETLFMPTHDDIVITDKDDKRLEAHFKEKNILMWTPHVLFT